MKKMKKLLSILLCLCMLAQNVPVMAFAAAEGNLCEHHVEHTGDCGYVPEAAEIVCTHEHTEECLSTTVDCTHTHGNDGCTYVPGQEAVYCGHVCSTELCGYVAPSEGASCSCVPDEDGTLIHVEGCGFVPDNAGTPCGFLHEDCGCAAAVEPTGECGHVCSMESGCEKRVYTCGHTEDGSCCFVAAAAGSACGYECSECAGEAEKICNCGTDAPAIHATTCAVYVAPENPRCYCVERCSAPNIWCEVCGFDHTACTGTDASVVYSSYQLMSGEADQVMAIIVSTSGDDKGIKYRILVPANSGIGRVEVCGYNDDLITVIIPSTITLDDKTYNVTGIAGEALKNCSSLTSISIPASVTSIGNGAFKGTGIECTTHRLTETACDICDFICSHKKYEEGKCTVCGMECDHSFYPWTGECTKCKKFMAALVEIVNVNETYYTHDEVVSGKVFLNGGTIRLCDDIFLKEDAYLSISNGTLDLNGFSLTAANGYAVFTTGKLTICNNSEGEGSINNRAAICAVKAVGDAFHVTVKDNVFLANGPVIDNGIHSFVFENTGSGILDLTGWENVATGTFYIKNATNNLGSSILLPKGYVLMYNSTTVYPEFSVPASARITVAACTEHSGGTAICTEQAVCEACGASYGKLADHSTSYSADGMTITYKCATCDTQTVTFTLVIPTGAVYGSSGLEVPHYDCSDKTYNGELPMITLAGKELKDFVPNAGTYAVTMIWGGQTVSGEYTIAPKKLTADDVTITLSPDSFFYDGGEKLPAVTIKLGNETLDGGTYADGYTPDNTTCDYRLGLPLERVKPGRWAITVLFMNNYSGDAVVHYTITIPEAILSPAAPNGENGWYKDASMLAHDGYAISTIKDGSFGINLPLSDGTYESIHYWLTYPDNENCEPVSLTWTGSIKVDGTAPTVSGTADSVTDSTASITVTAEDDLSGVASITLACADASVTIGALTDGAFPVSGMHPNRAYTFTLTAKDEAGNESDTTVELTTERGNSSIIKAPTVKSLTYTGQPQELVTAGSTNDGTMVYSLSKNGTYSETIPTGTSARTYTVYYKVTGDENHFDSDVKSMTVTIGKAVLTDVRKPVVTAPEALAVPQTKLEKGANYSAPLFWDPAVDVFDYDTAYTASISLTPSFNYVFDKEVAQQIRSAMEAEGWTVFGNEKSMSMQKTFAPTRKPILTVTAVDQTVTYGEAIDGTRYTFDCEVSGVTAEAELTANTDQVTDNGQILISGVVVTDAEGKDITNTLTIRTNPGDLTVTKRPATITAKDQTISYGEPISQTEITSSGLLDGHSVTATLTPSTTMLTENGTITASRAVIKANGADVTANYEISYEDGKLVIEFDTSVIDALDPETVNSEAQPDLEELLETIDELLEEGLTEEQEKTLADAKADAEALLDVIEAAQAALDTENTEQVEDVTADNVKPEDKAALEDAKADLEKALTDNSGNYTDKEKQDIRDEIRRIEDAVTALENAEAVEEAIKDLPSTVEPDDEDDVAEIEAAKKVYEELTTHEKSLVNKELREKLEELLDDAYDYDIIKGDGDKWTKGSDGSLSFTANGPFSKFIGIEVDGKEVDEKYYDAKSGSTIITLKRSFLKKLSTGKHTITVLYTDGETSGTFKIRSESDIPATGDEFNVTLHSTMLAVSISGLVMLILDSKKRKRTD